jgi:hypothetical protein
MTARRIAHGSHACSAREDATWATRQTFAGEGENAPNFYGNTMGG